MFFPEAFLISFNVYNTPFLGFNDPGIGTDTFFSLSNMGSVSNWGDTSYWGATFGIHFEVLFLFLRYSMSSYKLFITFPHVE